MINDNIDYTDAKQLREKAEKKLTERKLNKKQLTARQTKENRLLAETLLHEIQVHEIELEMQNEELRQAYQTAEKALKKYTMLFDLAPIGYFTLDVDGSICELNFTGADMLGERRFSLVNSNFKLFVSDESRLVFNSFFKKLYTNEAKESCEVSLVHNDKHLFRVYMEGVVTEDEQKCLMTVVDISKFLDR
ncbi:MAG: hypothetical protein P1P82_00810 [Bacteroidales bacterium]|nr:hypothetical protein [Bacteroidales bacterium]MDT8430096.1 hypothetical protein [Bacteroidales bacterium]